MTYPPDFTYPARKFRQSHLAAHRIWALAAHHRAVVQAGGCAGLWPLALANYFQHVSTFEPEPMNFACLQENVAAIPTITASPCALGARPDSVGLTRPKAQAGLWRLDGAGTVPVVRLDDVWDGPLDALVLDVEGAEVAAWTGATRLIDTYRPVLWFEYLHHTAAIDAFLTAHGYRPPQPGLGGDGYSVHLSQECYAQS